MPFEGNPGTNKLANVLSQRMKEENESPLVIDFGSIQADASLVTNTFPVSIPKGDYTICRQLTLDSTGRISPGDRVLVAWVQNEAVVIDIVTGS